ncbi:ATP-dependent ABC transporter [Scheffersomyces coipomensis]|uniref:ATP-dependent ABC transporter n=1 Tax=Scheffersomyces coipomensis TaxID=1788519 RepID=UPI00315D20FA
MIDSTILRIPFEKRIGLSVRNLTVTVKDQVDQKLNEDSGNIDIESAQFQDDIKSKILNDISFDLEPGKCLAIVGGSGSGKTTLLNTLSQRTNITNKKLKFDGFIEYDTSEESNNHHIKHAYLLQTDIFLPGLTVFETLKYQADLRLPPSVHASEKVQLIQSLLEVLELASVRDTIIAAFSSLETTLSGGEQRRVSLAIQLLSKPSILFLDEPTTGLDTTSSLKLVHIIKKLASPEYGMTIILSIHQPRSEITELFDKICLLTKGGRLVYYGNLADATSYFNNLHILQDQNNQSQEGSTSQGNFIEYIMELSVRDTTSEEMEKITNARINKLVESWKSERLPIIEPKSDFNKNLKLFSTQSKDRISFFREVEILTRRTFLLSYRDILSLLSMNLGAALLAVATGWMFFQPTPDLAGIRSITSTLYVMLEVIGFCPMYFELERLWSTDGVFFYREYSEQYVSISGFLLSRRLGKLFLEDLPSAIIFGSISYFMWGLRTSTKFDSGSFNSSYFGVYIGICILVELNAMGSSLLCFAVAKDFSISSLVLNVFYQLQNSACGYFVNAATMPVYVRWTKYLAYFWYGFGALTSNQFSNWMGACPYEHGDPRCMQYSGNNQLKTLGYPINWIAEPIVILLSWMIGFHILTAIAFYFKKFDVSIAKTKKNRIDKKINDDQNDKDEDDENESSDLSLIDEKNNVNNNNNLTQKNLNDDIDISIENLNLLVQNKNILGNVTFEKTLLENINATFTANEVNVIMGPSGSGKTTLLNYLSDRLPKTRGSIYKSTGIININNFQTITAKQLSHGSAYVTQHDNSLIHNLTVRETLYYQAKIRLPTREHKYIPQIITDLIRKTELIDCADKLIGSEYVKGISGGEKRRVSIAIQLLSKPKILFLDEPTSGLDSATACKILQLLDTLALENKTTVILTIHQPNQEMFQRFGSLLLLARGGKIIYNGSIDNIKPYFTSLNYTIPSNVNLADYILDLISKKMDEDKQQLQNRITTLIQEWKSHKSNGDEEVMVKSHKLVNIENYYHKRLPLYVTFSTIAERQILTSYRSRDVVISRAGQTIFLTIVHTLFFAPLRNSEEGISNRLGLIQEVLNLYFVGLVNNITLYPTERNLFYQEYKDGIYGVLEFSGSYLINELPTEIIPCLFFSSMIVFVCGLPRNPGMFFSMFATGFVSINCGESLGIMVNSCFKHLGVATNLLSNLVILAIFMGGTMSLHMPPFFRGINFISPMKYAVGICAELGLRGQIFTCSPDDGGDCILNTGEQVLEYYGLNNNIGASFGGLIACLIIYRLIAIASIYIRVKYYN